MKQYWADDRVGGYKEIIDTYLHGRLLHSADQRLVRLYHSEPSHLKYESVYR